MLAENGQEKFDLACKYNLGGFYQETVDKLIIEPRKVTVDVMNDVLYFLSENTDWVMGYQDIGDGEQCIYLTTIDMLGR